MVNDIKIPDFNLEDSFSIDGENTPTPPKKKAKAEDVQPTGEETGKTPAAATPAAAAAAAPGATKPKPKLLFEEEEESVEIMNPSAAFVKVDTKKTEEPLKQKAKPPEKQKPVKPAKPEKPVKVKIKKERKPMKLKYILMPLVVIVLGAGAFFAYTNGYVGRLVSKVSNIKDSFFATDSLAIVDSDGTEHNEDEDAENIEKAKEPEKPKVSSPYENEFLRKPATTTQQNKTTTAAKPASTSAKTTTPAATTTKTTTPAATTAKTTAPAKATTTSTKSTTSTNLGIPGTYSIQVCAWQEERTAKNEVRKIADNRLAARVVSVNLGQRGTWYRVMVGSYATEDEARRDLNRVMRTTGYENCIVREN